MKIKIWQQFSSNHSADFTLIGMFETADDAQYAAREIEHIIQTIRSWYAEDPPRAQPFLQSNTITPIEHDLSQQYDIEWSTSAATGQPHGLDWVYYGVTKDINYQAVDLTVYENIVFVSNIGNTYTGTSPFDRLLQKWGAKIAERCEAGKQDLYVDITLAAPDSDIADKIAEELNVFFKYKYAEDILPPPWANLPFYPYIEPIPGVIDLVDTGKLNRELLLNTYESIAEWYSLHMMSSIPMPQYHPALQNAVKAIMALDGRGYRIHVTEDQLQARFPLQASFEIDETLDPGDMKREGNKIILTNLSCYHPQIALPLLMNHYMLHGCQITHLHFHNDP